MPSGKGIQNDLLGTEAHRGWALQPRGAPRGASSAKCPDPIRDAEPVGGSVAFVIARTLLPFLGLQKLCLRRVGGSGAGDEGQSEQ
jgi:hypothetical protein